MRLQSTILQCCFTAAFFLVAPFTSWSVAYAADPDHGSETANLNIGGEVFGHGGGFPVALDSFNGLEIRDTQEEDGESDRLDLVRRYPSDGKSLGNNAFQKAEIKIGEVQWWYITKEVVNGKKVNPGPGLPPYINARSWDVADETPHELRKRDEELSERSNTVYLSLTTCHKPIANHTDVDGSFHQLEVYVSQSQKLQKPGPGKDSSLQSMSTASGGYLGQTIDASGDVFIGVAAPNSTNYTGSYRYQIAASIDAYFHAVNDGPFLYFVDADQHAALLVTNNLTQSEPDSENYQRWMDITPPYTMFAHNTNSTALAGLERSFCALDALAQVGRISNAVQVGMTSRGLGNKPKEQFYITGLNRSSSYNGILAMVGNSTASGNGIVGGGGQVWQPMNFSTKADNNCAVLFNLTFCSEVAYAVPSNPDLSVERLRSIYDDYAARMYRNFDYSLQQIQCNASSDSMYSLAVNCSTCATAYKQWLCSVSIPRCADYQNDAWYLQVRNTGQEFINGSSLPASDPLRHSVATNQSRNHIIDSKIRPGPYKEVLPCQDICYSLVKNCPSALGFGCPRGHGLNSSYGWRDPNGDITCSYLGAAYFLNKAGRLGLETGLYMLGVVMWTVWIFN